MPANAPLSAPRVAVVIVNYTTASLAAEAVRSVLAQDMASVVHLIDNASPGEDAAQLATLHKDEGWGAQVVLHLEDTNHGFGRGNNVALDALLAADNPPDHILLLNPDATLMPGALEKMTAFLDATPKAGCVGAQISKPQTGPVTAAFRFPSVVTEFVSTANIGPLTRLSGGRTLWLAPDIETQQVDWVAGAAVMFRADALRDVGTFDPDFFLYFEEVELMWRLNAAGWQNWYLREAQALHHEGAATQVRGGAQDRRPAYWYTSQKLYYLKTAGRLHAAAMACARLAGAGLHIVASRLRGVTPNLPTKYISDFNQLVLRPICTPTKSGKSDV